MLHAVTITSAAATPRRLQKDNVQRALVTQAPRDTSIHAAFPTRDRFRDRSSVSPAESARPSTARSTRSSTHSKSPPSSVRPRVSRQSLRVPAKGALLTSGFAYHPGLVDFKVHWIMWEQFTTAVVNSIKLSSTDRAKIWAAGTAAAVAHPNNYLASRKKSQQIQEDRVKQGLQDKSAGSLGRIIRQWNEGYFAERGLKVSLELDQQTPKLPLGSLVVKEPCHGQAHAERKFSILLSRQSEHGGEVGFDVQSPTWKDIERGMSRTDSGWYAESGFKPLPELPAGSDPLLDVAAELQHLSYSASIGLPTEPLEDNIASPRVAELDAEFQASLSVNQTPDDSPQMLERHPVSQMHHATQLPPIDVQSASAHDPLFAEVMGMLGSPDSDESQRAELPADIWSVVSPREPVPQRMTVDTVAEMDVKNIINRNLASSSPQNEPETLLTSHPAHRHWSHAEDIRGPDQSRMLEALLVPSPAHELASVEAQTWNTALQETQSADRPWRQSHHRSTSSILNVTPNWPLCDSSTSAEAPSEVEVTSPQTEIKPSLPYSLTIRSPEQMTPGYVSRCVSALSNREIGTGNSSPSSVSDRSGRRRYQPRPKVSLQHDQDAPKATSEALTKPARSPSASFFLPLDTSNRSFYFGI